MGWGQRMKIMGISKGWGGGIELMERDKQSRVGMGVGEFENWPHDPAWALELLIPPMGIY